MNYWIWLASIKDLGPIKKLRLLESFETVENVYFARDSELSKIEGITGKVIKNINDSKDEKMLKRYEEYILKNNIKLVNITDEEYPDNLRKIYAPPITLFAKGNIELLKDRCIAIVGCREPTTYGKNVAQKFASELCQNNFTIVSGMARGIDSASHIRRT